MTRAETSPSDLTPDPARRVWVYVTANVVLGGGDQILLMHARALRDSPYRMVLLSLEPVRRKNSLADELQKLGVELGNSRFIDVCFVRCVLAVLLLAASIVTALRLVGRWLGSLCLGLVLWRPIRAGEVWTSEMTRLRSWFNRTYRQLPAWLLCRRVSRYLRRPSVAGVHVLHAVACQALGRRFENAGVPFVYTEILTPVSYHAHVPDLKNILQGYSEIVVPAQTIAQHLENVLDVRGPFRVIPFTVPLPSLAGGVRDWPDRFNLGVIARLSEEKGHRYLIKALPTILEHCPQTRVILAGDGPERKELERLASELGLVDRISFLGAFVPPDLPRVMDQIDVLVLPSRVEGMPHVLVEGMAFGKPIVATPVGAVAEMIEEGQNGFLVPFSDTETLASRLALLLQDTDLRRQMGLRGRALFESKYDYRIVLSAIRQLCADHAAASPFPVAAA